MTNLTINLNLIGFDVDEYEKVKKQFHAINRMNKTQGSLKYCWQVVQNTENSPAHFYVGQNMPQNLLDCGQLVLTNQPIHHPNILLCSYPMSILDLMDVLAHMEKLIPVSALNLNDNNFNSTESISQVQPDNMLNKSESHEDESLSLYERANLAFQAAKSIYLNKVAEPESKIQYYGSYKQNESLAVSTDKVEKVDAVEVEVEVQTTTIISEPELERAVAQKQEQGAEQQLVLEPMFDVNPIVVANDFSILVHEDKTLSALMNAQGTVAFDNPAFYLDTKKQKIHTEFKSIPELTEKLLQQDMVSFKEIKKAPKTTQSFALPSLLWSYGLHHPNPESLLDEDLIANHEWRLKGFPKFGLWETNPTWLFLATFFGQKNHSIHEAIMQGKADVHNILRFMCAAHLAGLIWENKVLNHEKKQQQLEILKQDDSLSQQSNWIDKLRNKLQVDEYFKSYK